MGQQPTAPTNNSLATALATLIATNPAILQALAGTASNPTTLALLMQILMPNVAPNILQPQQQSVLSLLQLLSAANPASALLNYPSLLQQQQQQQPPPMQQAQPTPQLNQAMLSQLLNANAGGSNTNCKSINLSCQLNIIDCREPVGFDVGWECRIHSLIDGRKSRSFGPVVATSPGHNKQTPTSATTSYRHRVAKQYATAFHAILSKQQQLVAWEYDVAWRAEWHGGFA